MFNRPNRLVRFCLRRLAWARLWLAVLCALGACAPGQAQTRPEWKLKEGDRFYVETVNTLKGSSKKAGQEYKSDMEIVMVDLYRVARRDASGVVLEKTIVSRKFKSASGELDKLAESLGKKLEGNVLTVQLDPTWQKVMKIGGIKDYVKLFSADEKTEGEHEETIKEEQQIIFAGFLPDKAVEPGQRWQRKSSHESHKPTANYTAVEDYIYRGKEAVADRDADHIDAAWTVTFVPPKLEGVEVKQDLKAEPAKASYFFDSGAGRLVKSERSFHVKGKWTLIYQGKEIVTEVDQDENWRIRLTDENPLAKEK
ncbi:MAG TPA: hypothetical protein VGY58_11955 [Gemmataceae bacterium]|nr:hypothetical protein [Gemmataceae bacterium]